jgi:PBP1b-binding outer membrane lipoprotein LpoB
MAMTSWKTVFAAVAAAMLFAACAKKEEAPPAEEAPDVSLEVKTPEVEVTVPADPAASDANSVDAEASGGDKVSEPPPPPAEG